MLKLKQYLKERASLVNKVLREYLPSDNSLLSRSMRYSIFAGGKRLRPILVLEGALICGGEIESVLPAACAVEFLHTYSLIHDDLPAMDNDDYRRGKPTCHKKYNEAIAILTGDALLTESFRLLSLCSGKNKIKPEKVLESIKNLSEAAGHKGMIGGQIKDTIESGIWEHKSKKDAKKMLSDIHSMKTGALIKSSLEIGAIMVSVKTKEINALSKYAEKIGFAFQVIDDVLDITGNKILLGKKGSDNKNKKLTYPAVYGINESKRIAAKLVADAKSEIKIFGKKAEVLLALADYIVERQY